MKATGLPFKLLLAFRSIRGFSISGVLLGVLSIVLLFTGHKYFALASVIVAAVLTFVSDIIMEW